MFCVPNFLHFVLSRNGLHQSDAIYNDNRITSKKHYQDSNEEIPTLTKENDKIKRTRIDKFFFMLPHPSQNQLCTPPHQIYSLSASMSFWNQENNSKGSTDQEILKKLEKAQSDGLFINVIQKESEFDGNKKDTFLQETVRENEKIHKQDLSIPFSGVYYFKQELVFECPTIIFLTFKMLPEFLVKSMKNASITSYIESVDEPDDDDGLDPVIISPNKSASKKKS
ncbi:hypothetical protein RhiirA4_458280 [Rhizophagus irregularis]|uniref:Uncharacterized protein n=1 Tax=Rhizophagus irregularis TaxID=588596 RepID=A0A2I1GBW0_9GLOM|nr:hypothetical protein RhiirA4_458280 [Rhizophagus irregularis]